MNAIKVLAKIFKAEERNVPLITGVSVEKLNLLDRIPVETVDPILGVSDYTVGKFLSTEKSVAVASHNKYYQGNVQYWKGVIDSNLAKEIA